MNTNPTPKQIKTKVASRNVSSFAKTGGLHAHKPSGIKAGKIHSAENPGLKSNSSK